MKLCFDRLRVNDGKQKFCEYITFPEPCYLYPSPSLFYSIEEKQKCAVNNCENVQYYDQMNF